MEMLKNDISNYLKQGDHIISVMKDLRIESLDQELEVEGRKYFINAIDFDEEYIILLCEYYDEDEEDQSYFLQLTFKEYKEKFLG